MTDNIIVAGYLISCLIVGFFKIRRIRDMREYAIADRNYPLSVLVATMTATVIGSGSTFGIISSVYTFGIVYIFISLGNPLSRYIVGQLFVNKIERFTNCISVGDIMECFYGRMGRVVTGICGAIFCAAIVGGQVSAIAFIMQYFLEIPYWLGAIIGCGAVILYSTVGGVKAVAATDVLQFAVLIIAIPMVCNVGISVLGGLPALFEKIPETHLALPNTLQSTVSYLFLFITFSIPFLDPSQTQRFLMAKNSQQIRSTLRIAAAIEFLFFICIGMIGLIACTLNPGQEANLAFPMVINDILPFGLRGLAVAGLLAIVMSTADSYLNSAGITLVHDALKPLCGSWISDDKHELMLTQFFTFLLGTLATMIALNFDSIMKIIWFAYNFWAPIVIVPLYCGLLGKKNLSPRCFIVGSITAVVTFVLWYVLIELPYGVSALIPSMIANAVGFMVARHFQRPVSMSVKMPTSLPHATEQ